MNKLFFFFLAFFLINFKSFSQTNNLDYYINQALANSPLLKDYQNQVQSNLVDSQRIRASYLPQVTGNSNNNFSPVISGFGYDNAITNGGNLSAIITVSKTFVSNQNLNAQYQNIRLQNQAILNNSKISEQDLKRTIITQYITAYGDLQQVNFNREIYQILQKEQVLLKKLTQQNVYRQTDYLTFYVTLQQQALTLRQLQIQFRNDFATLNYLSGITDTAAVVLQEPEINLNALPEIENSVFFKRFVTDSLKLINSRDLIDFSYKPKLNVYADGGYNSSFAYKAYKDFGTSFGLNLTVPIYDGRQRKMQYHKIAISEQTRTNYKDFFTRQYNQQIAQLMQQLESTSQLIGEINNQIKYAESLITVNGKLLETGDAKIADYVIALNTYLTAKNLQTQNNISRMHIINQINYWNR